jgi:hypothetical protein
MFQWCKWILKWYWKMTNVEVQRRCRNECGTPPTQVQLKGYVISLRLIERWNVDQSQFGRPCSSPGNASVVRVLQVLKPFPKKSVRQDSHEIGLSKISIYQIFAAWEVETIHTKTAPCNEWGKSRQFNGILWVVCAGMMKEILFQMSLLGLMKPLFKLLYCQLTELCVHVIELPVAVSVSVVGPAEDWQHHFSKEFSQVLQDNTTFHKRFVLGEIMLLSIGWCTTILPQWHEKFFQCSFFWEIDGVEYSPQSPSVTPLHFNLWGSLKNPAGPETKNWNFLCHHSTPTVQEVCHSTMGITNFNLRSSHVRKMGKIRLNQSLIYIHPFPHSPYFFYLPLFNCVTKKTIFLGGHSYFLIHVMENNQRKYFCNCSTIPLTGLIWLRIGTGGGLLWMR